MKSQPKPKYNKDNMPIDRMSSPNIAKTFVSGWQFLPEMPEINKEVLVAIKHDEQPLQAYFDGKNWKASFIVRDNMMDRFVNNEILCTQQWIYAWMELPSVPSVPEPF